MLTDLKIRTAKPSHRNYKLQDQHGLCLVITPTNRKNWRFRYQLGNRRREAGLGAYPEVSICIARKEALLMRERVLCGVDPIDEKKQIQAAREIIREQTSDTFERSVRVYLSAKSHVWSETHRRDVARIFENELLPTLGSKCVRDISKQDVRFVLDRIIARNALTWVRDVLAYYGIVIRHYNSYSNRLAEDYSIALRSYLPSQPRETHHLSLPVERLGEFLTKLKFSPAQPQNRIAIELLILTLVRTTELRGATWDEFNFAERIWTIPANRMKGKVEHKIPLADRTIDLLLTLRQLNGLSKYVLRNDRSREKMVSENTFLYVLFSMGYRGVATPHGFRALGSSVLNESDFNSDAIERQLAHCEPDRIRKAYNRADYWLSRVEMMQWWAQFVVAAGNNSVSEQIPENPLCNLNRSKLI